MTALSSTLVLLVHLYPRISGRCAMLSGANQESSFEETVVYWWERAAGENAFMEITRREDIGADLKAPAAARGGVATASYALVALVHPGDVVIHYDSRQEAIIGVSVATS